MAVSLRPTSRRPGVLLLLTGFAAFGALTVLLTGAQDVLLGVDRPVARAVLGSPDTVLTEVMKVVSMLGGRAALIGLLVALTLWAVLARECPRALGVVITAFAAAVVLELVLKAGLDRPRPDAAIALVQLRTAAFPSGHALGATAVYGLLPIALSLRWPGHVLAWALVAVIGFSRLYLGAHWLSDVVGGAALGLAVVAAATMALRGHRLDPGGCPGPGHVIEDQTGPQPAAPR